ncbi:MAG: hypothetical protein AB2809_10500 [Candidatus Thiodiazotropha sp.]
MMGRPGMDRNAWKPDPDDDTSLPPKWFAISLLIVILSFPASFVLWWFYG